MFTFNQMTALGKCATYLTLTLVITTLSHAGVIKPTLGGSNDWFNQQNLFDMDNVQLNSQGAPVTYESNQWGGTVTGFQFTDRFAWFDFGENWKSIEVKDVWMGYRGGLVSAADDNKGRMRWSNIAPDSTQVAHDYNADGSYHMSKMAPSSPQANPLVADIINATGDYNSMIDVTEFTLVPKGDYGTNGVDKVFSQQWYKTNEEKFKLGGRYLFLYSNPEYQNSACNIQEMVIVGDVPEPASLALLATGSYMILFKRRRSNT